MHLDRLIALTSPKASETINVLPDVTVYRREAVSGLEAVIYEPLICLILQGSKTTAIGDTQITLRAGDALLVSHALPVVSRITQASPQSPYIALIINLRLAEVRQLYAQLAEAGPVPQTATQPLSCAPADPEWLEPLIRYIELNANPRDAEVLGPSVLREIHYRLLLSPIGQTLRGLLHIDSHASRIGDAIRQMRADFRQPLVVSQLAKTAAMSGSSFHKHFKSVTGVTPIQYQKDLRLIEARGLLVDAGASVSAVAYAVGYASPTHFSRDYRRKFGVAPSRDAHYASSSASQ